MRPKAVFLPAKIYFCIAASKPALFARFALLTDRKGLKRKVFVLNNTPFSCFKNFFSFLFNFFLKAARLFIGTIFYTIIAVSPHQLCPLRESSSKGQPLFVAPLYLLYNIVARKLNDFSQRISMKKRRKNSPLFYKSHFLRLKSFFGFLITSF